MPQHLKNSYTVNLRSKRRKVERFELENRFKRAKSNLNKENVMVEVGSKIDTKFTLKIVENGEEKEVSFDELLDRPVIVSVYMRNNTGGCDKQNRSLAEHSDWFSEKGYKLMALSKDSCGSHKNYADKLDINYILASDPEFKFARATDSIVEKKMYGKTFDAPTRSAYVIDTDGTVLGIIKKINTKAHAEELKELIESI